MDVYARLKELDITLPPPSTPVGLFNMVNQTGNMLYVSGQGSYYGTEEIKGRLGKNLTVEQGQLGARYCMLNMLAALEQHLGDLNKIERIVKLLGFVASDDDFHEQPAVINGASQTLIDIFGDNGRHARSAIGTSTLPGDLCVEIEAIVELKA